MKNKYRIRRSLSNIEFTKKHPGVTPVYFLEKKRWLSNTWDAICQFNAPNADEARISANRFISDLGYITVQKWDD